MLPSTTKSQISFEAFFTELNTEWIIVGASSPFEFVHFCSLYAWQSITDVTVLTKRHQNWIPAWPWETLTKKERQTLACKKHSYNTKFDSNFIFLDREYLLTLASRHSNFLDQRNCARQS